ncbi:glycosyltransferase [Catovirus CTV1]|uniref:Glycosyltransferase n=1 Tax=Catovirus CTV1 TaxID=1977631 RepID=A0A1V0SBR5_9VIRU|nr:glycosyltransferase [Catovirus CTV1]
MTQIPKIIHQIWLQGENNIPKDYPNYSESWKKLNPNFEYILWDQSNIENLIKKYFPDFLSKFNNYPKLVQKVDAAKYIILYVYGGVYVDMDLECLKNIDDLLNYQKIMLLKCDLNILTKLYFYHTSGTILQNCFAASVPKHNFWIHCVQLMMNQDIKQSYFELLEKYIFRTTGPKLITDAYYTYPSNNEIMLIDTSLFEPLSSCEYDLYNCSRDDCRGKLVNSYAFHHFGAKHSTHGWLSNSGKLVLPLFCTNQNKIIYASCFITVLLVVCCLLLLYRGKSI